MTLIQTLQVCTQSGVPTGSSDRPRGVSQTEPSPPSDVGGGVCGGEVVHAEAYHLPFGRRRVQEVAGEDLTARVAEILGQEGIEDRVDAGVSVGQAVGDDAEGEGGVVQREGAKLHPHGDDVMGHPADGEGGDDEEDGLSRLRSKNITFNQQGYQSAGM